MENKEMLVGDRYKIRIEDLNVTLFKCHTTTEKSNNPGQIAWTPKGYFNSIKECLSRMIDLDIQSVDDVRYISERQEYLRDVIKDLPFEEKYVYDRTNI